MILQAYPSFSTLLAHLHHVGEQIQRSKLDNFEVAALCVLFMFTSK